jgi:protein gp37
MPNPDAWWDATWNPIGGCSMASPGCLNCYAAREAATRQTATEIALYDGVAERWRGGYRFTSKLTELDPAHPGWSWPLNWKGAPDPIMGPGQPSLIFVGMMTDLFHEDRSTKIIDQVVSTLILSQHIGLLLTKRPERMAAYFTAMPESLRVRC